MLMNLLVGGTLIIHGNNIHCYDTCGSWLVYRCLHVQLHEYQPGSHATYTVNNFSLLLTGLDAVAPCLVT